MKQILIFSIFILFVSSIKSLESEVKETCKGGKVSFGKCQCPLGTYLIGNECLKYKMCLPGLMRVGNECVRKKDCPLGTIPFGNNCIRVPNRKTTRRRLPVPKPVIYLYPEKPMDISVQLNLKNSIFTTIYPKFNEKNTWNVHAKPNGDIILNNRTYPYLFWEASSYDVPSSNEGFIVTEENAEKFLEEKLEILGLNEKERTDFIVYWLPLLLKNKLSLCAFQTKAFLDNFELNITPKPDTLIRVYLAIKKLDSPINVKEQKLESVERKGYTAIEWGGINMQNNSFK